MSFTAEFIGGPWDGERKAFPQPKPMVYINLERMGEFPEDPRSNEPVEVELYGTYEREDNSPIHDDIVYYRWIGQV